MPDGTERDGARTLTAQEHLDLTQAYGVAMQLLMLDGFWTAEARRGSDPSTRESTRIEALDTTVDEMQGLLEQMQLLAPRVAETLQGHADEVREAHEALTRAGAEARLTDQALATIDRLVQTRETDDLASAVVDAAGSVAKRAPAEVQGLRAELDRLRADLGSGGDMSDEARDELLLMALGAAIVAVPEIAVAVVIVEGVVSLFHSIFG